jgi:hypothetical protein
VWNRIPGAIQDQIIEMALEQSELRPREDDPLARLVRDYEQRLDVSEAMIHLAMGSLLLRRIAHP